MPTKKIVIKKTTTEGLAPRVILKTSKKPSHSKTLHIPDPDDEEAMDNSAAEVVELNSSTMKDPVEQLPLKPENVEPSPKMDLTQDLSEPTFKFYCYRCGQKLKVPYSWANHSTTCGRCGRDVVVPPPLIGEYS